MHKIQVFKIWYFHFYNYNAILYARIYASRKIFPYIRNGWNLQKIGGQNMNLKKRGLALLMCICMIVTLLPVAAFADDAAVVYGQYTDDV